MRTDEAVAAVREAEPRKWWVLVAIGTGDAPVIWIATLLRGRDRRDAAPTAPPHGLCLVGVSYPAAA